MSGDQPDSTRTAVQCICCGSWLVSAQSVADRIGPVCAQRLRPRPAANEAALFEIPEVSP